MGETPVKPAEPAEKTFTVTVRDGVKPHLHNGKLVNAGDTIQVNEAQLKAFADKFQTNPPKAVAPPDPKPANSTSGPSDESATRTTLATPGGVVAAPVSTAVDGTAPATGAPSAVKEGVTPVSGATTPVPGATTPVPGSQPVK